MGEPPDRIPPGKGMPEAAREEVQFRETARRSWLGLVSIVLGLLALLVLCGSLALSAALSMSPEMQGLSTAETMALAQQNPAILLSSVMMLATVFCAFLGLSLGIGGLFQPGARKAVSIAGIALNGLYVCAFGSLFVLGIALQLAI
ncbi:MAG: hypothetical protein IT326_03040 [Anaerolineae bacterium]|nr:hypothetical protein [Anaerolineae bacterium]